MQMHASPAGTRAAAGSCPVPQRRRPLSIEAELAHCSADLDQLQRDVASGIRSHQRYDQLAEHAENLAARIRGAFRSSVAASATPIAQAGGKAWC